MEKCSTCKNKEWCSKKDIPADFSCYEENIRVCNACGKDAWTYLGYCGDDYVAFVCDCGNVLHVKVEIAEKVFPKVVGELLEAFKNTSGLNVDGFAKPKKKRKMASLDKY